MNIYSYKELGRLIGLSFILALMILACSDEATRPTGGGGNNNSSGSGGNNNDTTGGNNDTTGGGGGMVSMLEMYLTGGPNQANGKTWVLDSARDGHFGVGPNPPSSAGRIPEWYSALALEKQGAGFYDDRYTFYSAASKFEMRTNGYVYVNSNHSGLFPGAVQTPVGDHIAPFSDQLNNTWSLQESNNDTLIRINGIGFMGYYSGVREYEVIRLTDDELFVRMLDSLDNNLSWYQRFIREGYIPPGGGGGGTPVGVSLPIDFESNPPLVESFGGSLDSIIDNPDRRGINFSNKVLESIHGVESWAGFYIDLDSKLDFTTNPLFTFKIWSPNFSDTVRIKLEDRNNSNSFIELDVSIPNPYSWVEIQVPFGVNESNLYDRIVLFPGWGVPNAGTYYIDDIEQKL